MTTETKSILYVLFSYFLFSAETPSAVHANNRTERGMLTLFVFFHRYQPYMSDNYSRSVEKELILLLQKRNELSDALAT